MYLFVGDLFNIPLFDNSIDIVYTCHSLEPNGGHEKELLRELYRITNNYLILLEPAYELSSRDAQNRMEKHGYVKGLYKTAKELGYKILTYDLYGISSNSLNPTGLLVIEKKAGKFISKPFCDPLTKTELTLKGNAYFSQESLISYPILGDVPLLMKEYAVITTKLCNFY